MQFFQGNSVFADIVGSQYLVLLPIVVTSFILGMMFNFILSRASKPSLQRNNGRTNSFSDESTNLFEKASAQELSDRLFLAQQIKSVIKNLVNSQYVLKDKTRFDSLFQTPLRKSIHQLRLISENLLSSNTIDIAPIQLVTEPAYCCPHNAISKQVALLKNLATEYHVNFTAKCESLGNIKVGVTENWLASAIRELLFNAIKHNAQNINLSFTTIVVDDFLVLKIKDNGIGFPHAISQKFSDQASCSNTLYRRKSDSENLVNLSLIQDKLFELGGKLSIKSARKYETQVECWLPIKGDHKCVLNIEEENLPKAISNKPGNLSATPRLLCLSNDPILQDVIQDKLGQTFILQTTESVEHALMSVAGFRPDCVLIDEDSQVVDSLSVKVWIQSNEKFSDIPVVVLGGLIDKSTQLSVLQNGLSAFVEKPIVASELKTVIQNVVAEKNRMLQRVEEAIAEYHTNALQHIEYTDSLSDKFLSQFNEMLENNFHDDTFRLTQAANEMNMAEKTLSRRIAKYYELKFSDLIKKYRLNKAKELIIMGERITNVAYDTGFSSPSYFTQCFRAEYGFAPSMLARK